MAVEKYLASKRQLEVGLWALFFSVQWLAQFAVVSLEQRSGGQDFQSWEPLVWEGTSLLMVALLLPLILAWDHQFPLQKGVIGRNLTIHLLLTLPWSLLHVVGMVAMRTVIYHLEGGSYDFGNWSLEFLYEYLKDFRTYGILLSIIYLYRFLLVHLQGKAQLPEHPAGEAPLKSIEPPDRLLIKKLGKEFLVNVPQIEWVEAAGNYMNLHLDGRVYPLRDTMAKLLERLEPNGFARVHRSYIVRLDFIAEIEPLESGDARIHLENGRQIPMSRRYRDQLRSQLTPS
ncbi:LytR/AlgR family response regulator transcription factor [Microbulbifer sp. TYP-18]|uniref:LytR/AlgR family response regulator transcription factor n=1 Tax=Microbulbifer sp. TYP-18 TaxID=3230024 RepID=UPI0034C6D312